MSEAEDFQNEADELGTPQEIPMSKKGSEKEPEFEIEIAEEEQEKPKAAKEPEAEPSDDDDDDELENYSERVQKRIKKLTYERREEARRREQIERERDEALRVAQHIQGQLGQRDQLIQRGQAALVAEIKQRAQMALEGAKNRYRQAYDTGDPDKIIEAQDILNKAQFELREADNYERQLQTRPPVQTPQQYQQPQPQVRRPDPKAQSWADRNKGWFNSPEHPDMTATAYGIHEKLVRGGIDPTSDQYYETIDAEMHKRFPEYFGEQVDIADEDNQTRQVSRRAQTPPVAPSARNNGSRPSKVTLTRTQVAIAKRLGLTNDQYAKQMLKDAQR
jgi:hypothetical protein